MMRDDVVVKLRPATMDDAELLFGWANDPETRAASFSTDPIPWETHVAWLGRVIEAPDRRLWIAEDGEPVGQVRLDQGDEVEEISVSVAPVARGQGLAAGIIAEACKEAHGPVVAHIRPENKRSLRAFGAAGFVLTHEGDEVAMRWT